MKAIAPGKLILSGEHAVVHGCPALVTAISRHATVDVTAEAGTDIRFVTPFGDAGFTASELVQRLACARSRYDEFLAGARPIAEVVPSPLDFIALAWPLVGELPSGLCITIASTIPLGAGMGSSAAVSAAVLQALAAHAGRPLTADRCEALSLEMETFQHGHPSGVDSYVAVHGGMLRYTRDAPGVPLSAAARKLRLVHTGTPEATTGECVEEVARTVPDGHPIWAEFTAVCGAMERALDQQDADGLIDAVRHNHRLLVTIGVVPPPVADWIADIERAGGGAKICGAGSVRGPAGGMVWVVGDVAVDSRYTTEVVEGERHGVHIQE